MAEPKTKFWSRLNIYLGLYHNGRTKDKNFMKWKSSLICTAMAEPKAGVLGEGEEEISLTCTAMAKSGAMREPWISPSNLSKQVVCVLLLFLYMVCVCKFSSGRNDQRPTLEQSGILVFIGEQRRACCLSVPVGAALCIWPHRHRADRGKTWARGWLRQWTILASFRGCASL